MSTSHFVDDILKTENQASEMVMQAQQKAVDDLAEYREKLEQERSQQLAQAREKRKLEVKQKQSGAKDLYAKALEEGQKEADQLATQSEDRLSNALSAAEVYFLDTLMAA